MMHGTSDVWRRMSVYVCLSRTLGLSRERRGLGRLKLAEEAHVTRDSDTTFKVKSQRSTCRGQGHIVAASHTACYATACRYTISSSCRGQTKAPCRCPGSVQRARQARRLNEWQFVADSDVLAADTTTAGPSAVWQTERWTRDDRWPRPNCTTCTFRPVYPAWQRDRAPVD